MKMKDKFCKKICFSVLFSSFISTSFVNDFISFYHNVKCPNYVSTWHLEIWAITFILWAVLFFFTLEWWCLYYVYKFDKNYFGLSLDNWWSLVALFNVVILKVGKCMYTQCLFVWVINPCVISTINLFCNINYMI